ncbi:MAG: histidinol-phosphatase, partial [Mucilaginibacter sp.]|nr:histidinol-phosphatase [Mucilaginibacter sp.]
IDKSFPFENLPTRKPGTGMLTEFFSDQYDLKNSLVIGDRITDVMLAKNLDCKCVWMNDGRGLGSTDIKEGIEQLKPYVGIETRDWQKIYEYLKGLSATSKV